MTDFEPTDEQRAVIKWPESAFVVACPGAGKTKVMVERARHIFRETPNRCVAFLSFTNQAVSELERRLVGDRILPMPPFPNFVGTFDSFLWQFMLAPAGVRASPTQPKLVPDKAEWEVRPHSSMRAAKMKYFDRKTGSFQQVQAARDSFDPRTHQARYENSAREVQARAEDAGLLDFEDVRASALAVLQDDYLKERLGNALQHRFDEIVVDEAQDCNREDIQIIDWLRQSGIVVKIICDPNQAVYEFRGGLTNELEKFRSSFSQEQRKSLSGNFRSSPAICSANVALRPDLKRQNPDSAAGKNASNKIPVHIIVYKGAISDRIAVKFEAIIKHSGICPEETAVLASTWKSAKKSCGTPVDEQTQTNTLRLARAAISFQNLSDWTERKKALEEAHSVLLKIQGLLDNRSYGQYLAETETEAIDWRPKVVSIVKRLSYNQEATSSSMWLANARTVVLSEIDLEEGTTIALKLKDHAKLNDVLSEPKFSPCRAKSIHSVKGCEFPSVCVVLTSSKAKAILDHLIDAKTSDVAEQARKIYVGASRAQKLLALAVPNSQSKRLVDHLEAYGTLVVRHDIDQ